MAPGIMAYDAFPKTLDELKERTLGGALISIAATCLIITLFFSELAHFRTIETVDQLDVDVSSQGKILINLDIELPSIPCSELVVDVVDESETQQLAVNESLHKLRLDRHGSPMEVPRRVDWGHTLAAGFKHRKVMSLVDSVSSALHETIDELSEDEAAERSHDQHTHEEHVAHRRQLAHRAVALQEQLDELTSVADSAQSASDVLQLTHDELVAIRAKIRDARLYSDEQEEHVAANLDAMERNLVKLRMGGHGGGAADETANLQEALRIRLSILQDNLKGFVSPEDIDRRDRYRDLAEMLSELQNTTRLLALPDEDRSALFHTAYYLQDALDELAAGATGAARADAERRLAQHLELFRVELTGSSLPENYCGSCYGAARPPVKCCNTCDDVKAAYRARRWAVSDETTFEQCRRESKQRAAVIADGEGCNVYGTLDVERALGTVHIAPASSASLSSTGQPIAQAANLVHEDVAHFNVSHRINRLSFGDDFPGQVNPLDGVWRASPSGPGVARYFIKVVPTVYTGMAGAQLRSNQFASTEYFKEVREDDRLFQMPGIHFTYDVTPLRVKITERRGRTLVSFLMRCASTIGGVFTVAGMVDRMLYSSQRMMMQKVQIGKAS